MNSKACALLVCLSAALGASYRGGEKPIDAQTLAITAQRARYSESCLKRVVMERSSSFPVPAPRKNGNKFRLFYYGMTSSRSARPGPAARQVYPPGIMAEFDPMNGQSVCGSFVSKVSVALDKTFGPPLGPGADKLDLKQFKAKEAELYSSLAEVSAAYFAGRKGPPERATAGLFLERFAYLSEPGLKSFYRQLNPDLWKWVEELTGQKL